jgi:hypothetical protein
MRKKTKAEDIFKELNAAYQHNDLKKVSEILEKLLTGESFSITSDSLFDKKILKEKIEVTRQKIHSAKLELQTLKKDETFILVNKIDDLDEYLLGIKEELLEEKQSLLEKMKIFSQSV